MICAKSEAVEKEMAVRLTMSDDSVGRQRVERRRQGVAFCGDFHCVKIWLKTYHGRQ